MKIAQIDYTNTAPFFHGWPEAEFPLQPGVPTELARLAHRGEMLAGPLSIVECWKLEKDYEPLLDLGISNQKKCGSVLVFSKMPFSELNRVSIGVTRESASSVALCHTLLEQRYQNTARFRKGLQVHDAAWLVIGDQALKMAAQPRVQEWSHVTDLATEWWEWQKKPFVFARWIVRRDTPTPVRKKLEDTLQTCFENNMRRLAEVSDVAAKKVGLSPSAVETYLRGFDYRLNTEAEHSILLFREIMQRSVHASGPVS
jgi:chorismate dehydratase